MPHPSTEAGCQPVATEVVVGDDLVTAGGRVLAVIGTGADLAAARDAAYAGVAAVEFEGSQHRTDIALRASRQ